MLVAATSFVLMGLGLGIWFQTQNVAVPSELKFVFVGAVFLIIAFLVMYQVFALKNPTLTIDDEYLLAPCQPKFLRIFLSPIYPYLTCYEKVYFHEVQRITRTWTKGGGNTYILATQDKRKIPVRQNSFSGDDFSELWEAVVVNAPPESREPPPATGSHIRTFLMANVYYVAICAALAGYGKARTQQHFSASFEMIAWGWGLFVVGGTFISILASSVGKEDKNPNNEH